MPSTHLSPIRIGIDLGGTKTELIAIDERGAERYRTRVPTPSADYRAIVHTVYELVAGAERRLKTRAVVGIGTPGSASITSGLMRNSNTTCLNGRPLQRDLCEALGREVRIANDANCFALSEAVDGAARDARMVFGVILGTGTGGGVVFDRKVWNGHNAVAGEWGHNPLPWPGPDEWPGPECYCGRRGCIETFLCGPAIARQYRDALGPTQDATRQAQPLDARRVAARAEQGDALAQRVLDDHADRTARALASVINLLDPDVIVLGGGVSSIASLYQAVPRQLARHVFSDAVTTAIVPAQHGPSGGVRGAAWLWGPEEAHQALRAEAAPHG